MWGGEGIVNLGRPFLGRYVKVGQSRTWDGWGGPNEPEKVGRPLWTFPK